MCRINLNATLEDESIYVEEPGDPSLPVYMNEGANPVCEALRAYLRKHAARSIHLQMSPSLPEWRLTEIRNRFLWLVRNTMLHRRINNHHTKEGNHP